MQKFTEQWSLEHGQQWIQIDIAIMNQPDSYISQIIIKKDIKSNSQYLCSIQNINYPIDNGVFSLIFLTDQFNVSKFAEIEISLLLQTIYG